LRGQARKIDSVLGVEKKDGGKSEVGKRKGKGGLEIPQGDDSYCDMVVGFGGATGRLPHLFLPRKRGKALLRRREKVFMKKKGT